MSTVQIGGQDFILAGSNPPTIVASSYADFVVDALVPYDVWGGTQHISLQSAERRGALLQAVRLVAGAWVVSLTNYNSAEIRSSLYKNINLLVMGPFRPEPRPTSGYTYPRRTRL